MIGNDIIDLEASRKESNWQRDGWVQKIFTGDEQKYIYLSVEPELMVWLMWSMKEAAYKIRNRMTRQTFYAPQKFVCSNILLERSEASGNVTFGNIRMITNSSISKDYIHTTAIMEDNPRTINAYIGDTAKNKTPALGRPVLFKDKEGLPYLFEPLSGKISAVSVSHHGRFEAIVFAEK
jgi:phosphopantetheinyl transferase (holo-ACP synthase)